MRDEFIGSLCELAESDERIVLVTGDLGFGVLNKFWERFPNRFFNAGVAEQNMTAIACGLALEGRQVYTYSIGNFATLRCLEQIRNDVCYHDADVKVISIGGGFSYGQLGMSHFATEDIAILRALPNMTVIAPTDGWEAAIMARRVSAHKGPVYIRLDKGAAKLEPEPESSIQIGKARIVRHGRDVTLVATGGILAEAVAAADQLAIEGVHCRVLAFSTIKPLDISSLKAAAEQTGGIVTIEEHTVLGGLGGAVAEALLQAGVPPRRFLRVGLADTYPSMVGDQAYLRKAYDMDAAAVVQHVRALLLKASKCAS